MPSSSDSPWFYMIEWNKINWMLYGCKGLWCRWRWLKKAGGLTFCFSLSTKLFTASGFTSLYSLLRVWARSDLSLPSYMMLFIFYNILKICVVIFGTLHACTHILRDTQYLLMTPESKCMLSFFTMAILLLHFTRLLWPMLAFMIFHLSCVCGSSCSVTIPAVSLMLSN